jgi:hypothetical protein
MGWPFFASNEFRVILRSLHKGDFFTKIFHIVPHFYYLKFVLFLTLSRFLVLIGNCWVSSTSLFNLDSPRIRTRWPRTFRNCAWIR